MPLLSLKLLRGTMSDKSDLKAELERKKQRLAQIREEKKRKEEERKKKEVRKKVSKVTQLAPILYCTLACTVCVSDCFSSGHDTWTAELVCVSIRAYKHQYVCRRLVLEPFIKMCMFWAFFNSRWVNWLLPVCAEQSESQQKREMTPEDSDLDRKRRETEALLQSIGISPEPPLGTSHSRPPNNTWILWCPFNSCPAILRPAKLWCTDGKLIPLLMSFVR